MTAPSRRARATRGKNAQPRVERQPSGRLGVVDGARVVDDARASVRARAGEALDWENDDFVTAGKQKKNKKVPKAKPQRAPEAAPSASAAAAPAKEALDWENDDFVPASRMKNKKGRAASAATVEADPAASSATVEADPAS